ncbi:hypothetical protein SH501x_003081 [Pirellulaceae bacterium SH501]
MRIAPWLLAATPVAETPWQFVALLAIRAALALFVAVLAAEAFGRHRSSKPIAVLWLVGAGLAVWHSLGALWSFHDGSQQQAFQSTADQTQALLGVPIGAGLYVNYAFLAVWSIDASLAFFSPAWHRQLPRAYHWTTLGFLCFIALNATVVFKSGWLRWFGIGAALMLLALVFWQRLALGFRQERKNEQGD